MDRAPRDGFATPQLTVLVRFVAQLDSEAYAARVAAEAGFSAVLLGDTPPSRLPGGGGRRVLLTDRCGSAIQQEAPVVVVVDPLAHTAGGCSCCRKLSKSCGWPTLLEALSQTASPPSAEGLFEERPRPGPRFSAPGALLSESLSLGSPPPFDDLPADSRRQPPEPTSPRPEELAEETERLATLTRRELQVLRLVGQGLSVKQCADHLGISQSTIGNHKYRLMKKLRVSTSLEALRVAVRHGLAEL